MEITVRPSERHTKVNINSLGPFHMEIEQTKFISNALRISCFSGQRIVLTQVQITGSTIVNKIDISYLSGQYRYIGLS